MNYFIKITTDMKIGIIETEDYDWQFLAEQINCDYIEYTTIDNIIFNPRLCLIVDEDGINNPDKEINILASSLSLISNSYGLYGDVIIAQETINEHGFRDITSLSEGMAYRLLSMFKVIVKTYKEEKNEI